MNYIDADKLIAEIERRIRIKENLAQHPEMGDMKESLYNIIDAYKSLKSFIFLQQEQPELPGYDKALLDVKSKVDELYEEASIGLSEYDSGFYNGIVETCMKLRGFIKARISSEEQPEMDLDKEFNDFLDNVEGVPRMWHSDEQIEWGKDIARHFYGLRNRVLEEAARHVYESWNGGTMDDVRRYMVELGKVLNARKEE